MKQNKQIYTLAFYNSQIQESLVSAKQVVPEIIKLFNPRSVIDVGCGVGTWGSAFLDNGVSDFLGIDGDYVKSEQLLIPEKNFIRHDLRQEIVTSKKFDIAMSLEVIEHLTDDEGKFLIKSLVKLAPVVIFSAAIPGQGGTNHINEQWQSYWAQEFSKYNYKAYDCIRPLIWNNKEVYVCYKQNIIVYISSEYITNAQKKVDYAEPVILDMVHPQLWNNLVQYKTFSVKTFLDHCVKRLKSILKKL